MTEYRLCKVADLPPEGEASEFECAGQAICVAKLQGELRALDNVCIHRGGPLGQGMVEDGKIVCPWHGWAFDLKTGAVGHNPRMQTKVHPVRVDGDDVLIDL